MEQAHRWMKITKSDSPHECAGSATFVELTYLMNYVNTSDLFDAWPGNIDVAHKCHIHKLWYGSVCGKCSMQLSETSCASNGDTTEGMYCEFKC